MYVNLLAVACYGWVFSWFFVGIWHTTSRSSAFVKISAAVLSLLIIIAELEYIVHQIVGYRIEKWIEDEIYRWLGQQQPPTTTSSSVCQFDSQFNTDLFYVSSAVQIALLIPRAFSLLDYPMRLQDTLNKLVAPSMYLVYSYLRINTLLPSPIIIADSQTAKLTDVTWVCPQTPRECFDAVEPFFLHVSIICVVASLLIRPIQYRVLSLFHSATLFLASEAQQLSKGESEEKVVPDDTTVEDRETTSETAAGIERRSNSDTKLQASKPKRADPEKSWYIDNSFGVTKNARTDLSLSILLACNDKQVSDRFKSLALKNKCSLATAVAAVPVNSLLSLYHFHSFILDFELPDVNQIYLKDIEAQLLRSGYPVVIVALIPPSLATMKNAILEAGISAVICKDSSQYEKDFKAFMEFTKKAIQSKVTSSPPTLAALPTTPNSPRSTASLSTAQHLALQQGKSYSVPALRGLPQSSAKNTNFVSKFPNAVGKRDGSAGYTIRALARATTTTVADEVTKLERMLTSDTQKQVLNTLRAHLEQLSMYKRLFDSVVAPQFQSLISPLGLQKLSVGAHVVKGITVVFTDIRDFSSFAEKHDAQAMIDFFNDYLSFAMPPITSNHGFVDKFIGDSIMAIFSEQSHPSDAVRCAIEIMKNLEFRSSLPGFAACDTGIGINSGSCTIGLVGTEIRMEPTVLGDAVNLASRTESLCKRYGSKILITGDTYAQIKRTDLVCWVIRQLDHVCVMGKQKPTMIYEIIDGECNPQIFKLKKMITEEHWGLALELFKAKNFAAALTRFQKCLMIYPEDIPSSLYINRCVELLRDSSPEEIAAWNFIYELRSK